jgi:anti-sigma factor RsiW
MTTDQLEFAINQYLDGTLPADEAAALEERLATDSQARQLFAGYQNLNGALKSSMPIPQIAWDDFSRSVSEAVAKEEPPVRTYKLHFGWIGSAIALAACVAIGFGIFMNRPHSTEGTGPIAGVPPKTGPAVVLVTGPTVDAATQPAVAQITISAPSSVARSNDWRYAEEIVTRPSRVIIASGAEPAQDSSSMPY